MNKEKDPVINAIALTTLISNATTSTIVGVSNHIINNSSLEQLLLQNGENSIAISAINQGISFFLNSGSYSIINNAIFLPTYWSLRSHKYQTKKDFIQKEYSQVLALQLFANWAGVTYAGSKEIIEQIKPEYASIIAGGIQSTLYPMYMVQAWKMKNKLINEEKVEKVKKNIQKAKSLIKKIT